MQVLFHLGELVTATQSVNDETLQLLGAELNYSVQVVSPEEEDKELLESFDIDFGEDSGDEGDLAPRPPVVTVMGHVDHGKTRLLDAIRNTNEVAREAGGITQHIGAYQVTIEVESQPRKVTFIDTPGHEAFTAMRARGAETTDLVVLVVAADDGVKPQTTEALNHAQAAGVPIVVAVNKIDKEGADPQRVRTQLTEYGLVAEEFGGQTLFIDVSARERIGLDSLLEAIVLTADAALDLRANPNQDAQGVAIEAHLDRGRGPVATVLVQRGTLRPGDSIVAGDAFGRVRAMLDENSDQVAEAPPSRPVQVLGLTAVPGAGESTSSSSPTTGWRAADRRAPRGEGAQRAVRAAHPPGHAGGPGVRAQGRREGGVAADHQGRRLRVGRGARGRAGEDRHGRGRGPARDQPRRRGDHPGRREPGHRVGRRDHRLQRPPRRAGRRAGPARGRGHPVLLGDLPGHRRSRGRAAGHAQARSLEEVQLGTAEVREVFRVPRIGNVAGCIVRSGTINRGSKARLVRDGVVVSDNLTVDSLRRFKDDATEVREGYECGIGVGYNDIRVEDVIETSRDTGEATGMMRPGRQLPPRYRYSAVIVYVGTLALDVLLGDVRSLKQKRSVVRPLIADLRRGFPGAAVAETGHLDAYRRTEIAVAVVASTAGHCTDVLTACEAS